jgi:hypothetical protein
MVSFCFCFFFFFWVRDKKVFASEYMHHISQVIHSILSSISACFKVRSGLFMATFVVSQKQNEADGGEDQF